MKSFRRRRHRELDAASVTPLSKHTHPRRSAEGSPEERNRHQPTRSSAQEPGWAFRFGGGRKFPLQAIRTVFPLSIAKMETHKRKSARGTFRILAALAKHQGCGISVSHIGKDDAFRPVVRPGRVSAWDWVWFHRAWRRRSRLWRHPCLPLCPCEQCSFLLHNVFWRGCDRGNGTAPPQFKR